MMCEKKDVVLTFNHQEIIAVIAVSDEDFFSGFFSAFLAKRSPSPPKPLIQNDFIHTVHPIAHNPITPTRFIKSHSTLNFSPP